MRTGTLACLLAVASWGCSSQSLLFNYDVEDERPVTAGAAQLERRLATRGEVAWKIPLGTALLEELRWIDDDRIYAALRMDSARLENLDHFVASADTGRILWRRPRPFDDRYTLLYDDADLLLFVVDGGGDQSLRALAADTGDEVWSIDVPGSRSSTAAAPAVVAGSDLVVVTDARRRQAVAVRLSTGTKLWRRRLSGEDDVLLPLITDGTGLWNPNGPLQRLDTDDGSDAWPDAGVIEIDPTVPPQFDGDTLVAVTGDQLVVVDAQSGALRLRAPLPGDLRVTNLFPADERLYVRARSVPGGSTGMQSLTAIDAGTGSILWTHETTEPSLSNLVGADGFLYHATASTVYKLDEQSGRVIFTTAITDTGRSFPVRLRRFDDHVAYIGELVVAGVNSETGAVVFRHGLTPISAETSLNALDYSIPHLEEQMGAVRSDGMSFSLGEAQRFQNMANAYARQAQSYQTRAFMAGSAGLDGQADSARFRALEAQGAANRASRQARTAATVEMSLAVMNLAIELQDLWKTAGIKARLDRQTLFRQSILSGYAAAENEHYVFRPHTRYRAADDHFAGLQIMHLPSGRRAFSYLSAAYGSYGLWNLVDFRRGRVIHHGVGLKASEFTYGEPVRSAPMAPKIRHVESFLMAAPVRLP